MDEIYERIWELARPYYEKGRPYDIIHIEWMVEQAEKTAEKEGLDKRILIPLAILHDVGYSEVEDKNHSCKSAEHKKLHMEEGVKIARKILNEIDYDKELTEKIIYLISVHDNWVFGDSGPYKKSKELAVFNDLDFIWVMVDQRALKNLGKSMKMGLKEVYEFFLNDEKHMNRPFCCEMTRKLWKELSESMGRKIEDLKHEEK